MSEPGLREQLLHSVCRVEARGEVGRVVSTGTFFHFASGRAGRQVPALLLSRRALAGASRAVLTLRAGRLEDGALVPEEEPLSVEIPDVGGRLLGHPSEEVDLCALPVAPLAQLARHAGKRLYYVPLEEAFLGVDRVLQGLHKVEEVVVAGCVDEEGAPRLRVGLTGEHPKEDFRGHPLGLVDRPCVPGAAGSPVVLADEESYLQGERRVEGERLVLLGTMTDRDPFTVAGEGARELLDVGDAPGPDQSAPGLYVKARCLLELGRHLRDRLGTVRGS